MMKTVFMVGELLIAEDRFIVLKIKNQIFKKDS